MCHKSHIRVDDFVDASITFLLLQGRSIKVEPVLDSDIIEIYSYSDNLDEAQNIANEIIYSYITFNEKNKTTQGGIGGDSIRKELKRAELELEAASLALQEFQENEVFLNFNEQSKLITDECQRLEEQLLNVKRDFS